MFSSVIVGIALVCGGAIIGAVVTRWFYVIKMAELEDRLEQYRNKYERVCEENLTLNNLNNWELDDGQEDYFKPF